MNKRLIQARIKNMKKYYNLNTDDEVRAFFTPERIRENLKTNDFDYSLKIPNFGKKSMLTLAKELEIKIPKMKIVWE